MFKSSIILVFFATYNVNCNMTSPCNQKEICNSYLNIAVDMIAKAKQNIPTCKEATFQDIQNRKLLFDCADVFHTGHNESGIYKLWPVNRMTEGKPLYVYCDMDTDGGGWTVIQRRGDFGSPKDFFDQNWESYKVGFGDIQKDFWLGNDNIFALTNQKFYSVRFDLKDVEQKKRFALYENFWIDDENQKYTLHISVYSGDAGDSMIAQHNNKAFSTKDRDNDNDRQHCAVTFKGGWWYNACHLVNLNGLYHKGKHDSHADGVYWYTWKGQKESLEWSEIKIRPRNFSPSFISSVIPV